MDTSTIARGRCPRQFLTLLLWSCIKHGKRPIPFSTYALPYHAIDYCLSAAGIRFVDVDHVAYAYDPSLLLGAHRGDATVTLPLELSAHPTPEEWEAAWDPLFLSSVVNAPRHLAGGAPHHLQARFSGARPDGPYHFTGASWSTTSPTRPAPSTSRRSSMPPC